MERKGHADPAVFRVNKPQNFQIALKTHLPRKCTFGYMPYNFKYKEYKADRDLHFLFSTSDACTYHGFPLPFS